MNPIKPGCYERDPVWVDAVFPAHAMMGATEKERQARRDNWRKLYGGPVAPVKRKVLK
jgi:hypothetical protein